MQCRKRDQNTKIWVNFHMGNAFELACLIIKLEGMHVHINSFKSKVQKKPHLHAN